MWVGLVEYGVFNWPKGLEGWRLFRIEYGGFNEECLMECNIWLPPNVDPLKFGDYLQELFSEEKNESSD